MKLGLDLDVERRRLEPRAGEPFDARRSEKLDAAVVTIEDAQRLRRQAEAEHRVVRVVMRFAR